VTTHKIPPRRPWRWRGHAYLVNAAPPRRVVDACVLLVGDAAGVADPQGGEGTRQAVESGLLAARTIVEARGHFSRDRLEPYAECVRTCFDGPSPLSALGRIVPAGIKTAVAEHLLKVPAFVKRVVLDQWFLHRDQLPLVPTGASGAIPT
jgi:hypothetical protein